MRSQIQYMWFFACIYIYIYIYIFFNVYILCINVCVYICIRKVQRILYAYVMDMCVCVLINIVIKQAIAIEI